MGFLLDLFLTQHTLESLKRKFSPMPYFTRVLIRLWSKDLAFKDNRDELLVTIGDYGVE